MPARISVNHSLTARNRRQHAGLNLREVAYDQLVPGRGYERGPNDTGDSRHRLNAKRVNGHIVIENHLDEFVRMLTRGLVRLVQVLKLDTATSPPTRVRPVVDELISQPAIRTN